MDENCQFENRGGSMPEQVVVDGRRAEIGRARREKTRARLIAAAARVVARLGQGKATIDDFIQEAGVARGTFYNYFPARENLIDALWSHVGRAPFLEIHESCRRIKDPAFRLVSETRMIIERAGTDEAWGWLVYSLSADFEGVNEDLLSFPLPTLEEGLATKRLIVHNLNAARDAVVNIARGGILARLTHRSSPEYELAVCHMILVCLGIPNDEAAALAAQAALTRAAVPPSIPRSTPD